MNTNPCDQVAERIALGEPLGELAEHARGCARCERIVHLPAALGRARQDIDPGLGFAARMTVGAQHRLAVRKRRRIAGGLAVSVAAGLVAVFAMTRSPEQPAVQEAAVQPRPADEPALELPADELKVLVRLADTKRSRRLGAHWARIQRPLAGYRALVQSEDPASVLPAVAPTNGGSP